MVGGKALELSRGEGGDSSILKLKCPFQVCGKDVGKDVGMITNLFEHSVQ